MIMTSQIQSEVIITSFSIPTFSEDVAHHQDNRALLTDRAQEYLRHWLTRRRFDSRFVILDTVEQT